MLHVFELRDLLIRREQMCFDTARTRSLARIAGSGSL
jgi:hypothetical protein